jgi:hypothetical protein
MVTAVNVGHEQRCSLRVGAADHNTLDAHNVELQPRRIKGICNTIYFFSFKKRKLSLVGKTFSDKPLPLCWTLTRRSSAKAGATAPF